MEMPKPGPGHKKIAALAGNWVGEDTMFPSQWDPHGGTATGTMISRVAIDGFYVVGDYEQKRGSAVTFRGHAVWGYDARADEVVLHWFDSSSGGDPFRGKIEGQRMTLLARNAMGQFRLTYDLGERDTLRTRMELSPDGKEWKPMMESVYHRKS